MITNKGIQTKKSPFEGTEQLQQILLSLIPATSVLLVGAYGSQMVKQANVIPFSAVFLLASVITFIGEKKIMALVQHAQNIHYLELATICREFLAGNLTAKVKVQGHNELSHLAEAINLLLDQQRNLLQRINTNPPKPVTPSPPPPTPKPQNNEVELLNQQLMQIINDLSPVTQGDLRVRMSTPGNLIGIIADACNSFIEELAQFVKWTRYASLVVTTTSQNILDRSLEMAKNTEDQMHRLSSTTNNIEEIASFMQHLNNTLHLNIDMSKEIQRNISKKIQQIDHSSATPVGQLLNELQRQTELLEGILQSTEETSTRAESLIGDLYTVAQQIYQSSISTLKTVKRLSELETLAERWHTIATAFTVQEEEDVNLVKEPWLL